MNRPFVFLLLHLHVSPVTDLVPAIVSNAQNHCSVLEGAIRGTEVFTWSTDRQIGEVGPYAAGFVLSKSLLVRSHCSLSGKGIQYCQQVEGYNYHKNDSPRLLLLSAGTVHAMTSDNKSFTRSPFVTLLSRRSQSGR